MRRFLFLLPLLVLASGCDGAFVAGDDVSVQIVSGGLAVTNDRAEPIYVAAFGEWALIYVDPLDPTPENPGFRIDPGVQTVLPFSEGGLLRSDDGRFVVNWLTLENGTFGARGSLRLER